MKSISKLLSAIEASKDVFFATQDKSKFANLVSSTCGYEKDGRSVYYSDDIAVRFSFVKGCGFSNTVLSLKLAIKYDDRPLVIVVLRHNRIDCMLANLTFIRKISHSSKNLEVDNIRGSFNGTDIMTEYEEIQNSPKNFDQLFEAHSLIKHTDNIERLVLETKGIKSVTQKANIDNPADFAAGAYDIYKRYVNSEAFSAIYKSLRESSEAHKETILKLAEIDNVNLRGNRIEAELTGEKASHSLEDVAFDGKITAQVDIKTKLKNRQSSPKAYNIDKFLRLLRDDNQVLLFFCLLIDTENDTIDYSLCTPLDSEIIKCSTVQHHWAGRGTRGVVQFTNNFTSVFKPGYRPDIQADQAKKFLTELVSL